MKKLLVLMLISFSFTLSAKAQTEVKVKPTKTPTQRVYNATHRKKHYKGYKVKRRTAHGHRIKRKVDTRTGEVEVKRG